MLAAMVCSQSLNEEKLEFSVIEAIGRCRSSGFINYRRHRRIFTIKQDREKYNKFYWIRLIRCISPFQIESQYKSSLLPNGNPSSSISHENISVFNQFQSNNQRFSLAFLHDMSAVNIDLT